MDRKPRPSGVPEISGSLMDPGEYEVADDVVVI